MVCHWIQMKGVTLVDPQLSGWALSHRVIQENLGSYNTVIQEYRKQRDQVAGAWRGLGDPAPHDSPGSCIHDYLWGYSIRSGCLGKLAGLIYRIIEFTRELLCCCCNSHRRKALREIADFLEDANKIMPVSDSSVEGTRARAAAILEKMLTDYNIYCN